MIELDQNNPSIKKTFTARELLLRLAEVPNLQIGYAGSLFLKDLVQKSVKGQIGLEMRNGQFEVTLHQPNDEDKAILGF